MVLVTGGTGFLGSYIIKELVERNYPVRAIRRSTSKVPLLYSCQDFGKSRMVEADILDPCSLEEAIGCSDAVIHSAAIISFLQG
jgi:nucleoside-diphosphate-sugar epimerase